MPFTKISFAVKVFVLFKVRVIILIHRKIIIRMLLEFLAVCFLFICSNWWWFYSSVVNFFFMSFIMLFSLLCLTFFVLFLVLLDVFLYSILIQTAIGFFTLLVCLVASVRCCLIFFTCHFYRNKGSNSIQCDTQFFYVLSFSFLVSNEVPHFSILANTSCQLFHLLFSRMN